jgi:glucose/arabinose dehydrogenase
MRVVLGMLLVLLAGCPSGASSRGVERPGTTWVTSAKTTKRGPTCRGRAVDAWTPPGFCLDRYASGLVRPRHLLFAPNGDLLVATRTGIVVLWDGDSDGVSDEHERATLGGPDISQQGIALSPDARFLYIADSRFVRRLPFRVGMRASDGPGEIVIGDVPLTVDHPYRSLTVDAAGRLYLSVGADDNLTPGGGAQIRRFTVPDVIPKDGIPYASGEPLAVGIRNAEALAWDHHGRLWAFVNGRDFLRPPGTDETFYLDHPGDWIFRLSERPGTFYGFPSCWVLGNP